MTSRIKAGLWGGALLLLAFAPGLDRPLDLGLATLRETWPVIIWAHAAYLAGHGLVQGAALVALALSAAWAGRRRLARSAWTGLAGVAGAGLLVQVIKRLVGRPRPRLELSPWELMGPISDSDFHSFPSGHTATSFALAAFLAARYPRWAGWFYLGAALVAAGRVLGGSHYLSDVLGGIILGLMVGLPLVSLARALDRRTAGEPAR